jgi:hypothetical protein
VFLPTPAPTSKEMGSSSHELRLYFRACDRYEPAKHPKTPDNLLWNFAPYHDTSKTDSSRNDELSTTRLSSVLSVPPALDGLHPVLPCRLVSSCSRLWDSPYKGFPRYSAELIHHQPVPSWRFIERPLPETEAPGARTSRRAFKALIQAAIRYHQQRG